MNNYPPGVTGSEREITGPTAAEEAMWNTVADKLNDLFDELGAEVPEDEFDEILSEVAGVVERYQGEVHA